MRRPALRDPYGDVCRACVALYLKHRRGAFFPSDQEHLEIVAEQVRDYWSILSLGMAHAPGWGRIGVSVNHRRPGFITARIGSKTLDIPFFLAPDFPRGKLLDDLYALAMKVRRASESTICISGSTCLAGSLNYFSDVDFCEYVASADQSLIDGLRAAINLSRGRICCYRVKLGKDTWERPSAVQWQELASKLSSRDGSILGVNASRQCAFLAHLGDAGVFEATDILLLIDPPHSELGEGKKTFPQQEVPVAGSWIPKDIASPLEIGRYVIWLLEEVERLITGQEIPAKNVIKAAKRALSLTRILFMVEEATVLISILNRQNGARLAALADRCAMLARISAGEDDNLRRFLPALKDTIDRIRNKSIRNEVFYTRLTLGEERAMASFALKVSPLLQKVKREVMERVGIVRR